MSLRQRWGIGVVVGFLLLNGVVAEAGTEDEAIFEGCKERFAIVLGVDEVVRKLIPPRYVLVPYPGTDRPLVFVTSLHCDKVTVNDVSAPTTLSMVAAVVESPDGTGCFSATPFVGDLKGDALPVCNFYVLWDVTDNASYASFLRDGTPDFPIWVTDDLSFDNGEFDVSRLGVPFNFRTGPSAPFTLESDFVVRDRPGVVPVTPAFWTDTEAGAAKLAFFSDNLEFGEASGTVRTELGSKLAEIFGGEFGEPAPGLSMIGAPRWARGVITKSIVR